MSRPGTLRAALAALTLVMTGCASHHKPPRGIAPLTLRPPVSTGLDTLVRMKLPDNTPDISTAALFILQGSGYTYASRCQYCPVAAAAIAKEPVSPLAYIGGITTVRRALLLIAGSNRRLIVDDRAKVVTIDDWTGS